MGNYDFSILTPSFNAEEFISNSYFSLLKQNVSLQWIIQDGGSVDKTLQIISQFSELSISLESREDSGQSEAMNLAMPRIEGKYTGWLNTDEMYLPGVLDEVASTFELYPEIDIIFGDVIFSDSTGSAIRLLSYYPKNEFVFRQRGCSISTSSFFIRSSKIGNFRFDSRLRVLLDWDMFLYFQSRKLHFFWINKPLSFFTIHPNQITAEPLPRYSNQHQIVREKYKIRSNALKRFIADWFHLIRKIYFGSYLRQYRFRKYKGRNFLLHERA